MATYSDAVLDEIRSRVDIVDIVSQLVGLRKAGANWKGLCPFHTEKTPSFMVNPARGIFHCFGCGVGGDVFGFLMRQDRLSFPEAVRALARKGAVELPEERARGGESDREDLYRAMHLAETFYAENLWHAGGERARQYLETRGVDPAVAKRFGLGYAPDGWDSLLSFMRGQKIFWTCSFIQEPDVKLHRSQALSYASPLLPNHPPPPRCSWWFLTRPMAVI